MIGTLTIGGIEHEYEVLHNNFYKLLLRWNTQYDVCTRNFKKENGFAYIASDNNHQLVIPNKFYFYVIWECLVKRGKWFWKKPYKSMKHMSNHIRKDEFQSLITLAGRDILELQWHNDRNVVNTENNKQEIHND